MRSASWIGIVAMIGCAEPECDVERGTEPGNLVVDGGFDQGFACWYAVQANEERQGFSLDEDHPASGARPSMRAAPDQAGDPLRTQLMSAERFRIEGGETYEFGFEARAASQRSMLVFVQECCSPLIQHLFEQPQLRDSWQSYAWRFTAAQTSDQSYVDFQLGDETPEIWIDQVYVRVVED